jgi:hypothetical protein
MRIGVLLTVYNCENYIKECLDPWFEIRDQHEVIISANSGMFSDYYSLEIPYRNKKTLDILSGYDIDFLVTTKGKNLLGEDESRNLCLNFLNKNDCDLVWVLDGDEAYTRDQILNILDYINEFPEFDWYSVNFKNLTVEENLFQDYTHERIIRSDRKGGINSFYFDNQFTYNDGTHLDSAIGKEIPKRIAYVKHYCWLSDDLRTKDKIKYQRWRYCGPDGSLPIDLRCTYSWNEDKNCLEFSEEFHKGRGIDIPCLHEKLSEFSHDFTINYTRHDGAFKITKVQKNLLAEFEIFNGEENSLIYKTILDLSEDVNYYMAPIYKIDDFFYNFRVKAYVDDILIHDEKIHLKLK